MLQLWSPRLTKFSRPRNAAGLWASEHVRKPSHGILSWRAAGDCERFTGEPSRPRARPYEATSEQRPFESAAAELSEDELRTALFRSPTSRFATRRPFDDTRGSLPQCAPAQRCNCGTAAPTTLVSVK